MRACKLQGSPGLDASAGRPAGGLLGQVREPLGLRLLNVNVNIDGTDAEREFFHTYRLATEAGVALHVNNVSSFWSQVAPQLGHHDEAIKHALVALGAAYHLSRARASERKGPKRPGANQHGMEKTNMFVLKQYNAAVGKLQEHIASGSPQSITVALACCLMFVCLENLRGNYRGGVAHLISGTRIIDTTLDVDSLCSSPAPQLPQPIQGRGRTSLPFIADKELKGLVNYFRHAEICECLFSHDVPLVIASRLYAGSRFDNGATSLPAEFTSLAEAYEARVKLTNDVMARDWEIRTQRGDSTLPPSRSVALEQPYLYNKAALVCARYEAFLAGEHAPRPRTREYLSSCLDMLLIKSMQATIAMMPLQGDDLEDLMKTPYFAHSIIGEIIRFAELLYEAMNAAANSTECAKGFTIETGIVAPTYFAYVHTTVPDYRTRALRILEDCNAQEGPWTATYVARLLKTSSYAFSTTAEDTSRCSPGMRKIWTDDLDCHRMFSELKIRDDKGQGQFHAKHVGLKSGKHAERKKKGCFPGWQTTDSLKSRARQ